MLDIGLRWIATADRRSFDKLRFICGLRGVRRHDGILWKVILAVLEGDLDLTLAGCTAEGGRAATACRSAAWRALVAVGLAAVLAYGSAAAGVELEPKAVAGFARCVELTDLRNARELESGAGLLWVDALAAGEREADYAALRRGEVELRKLQTLDGAAEIKVPGALIHHWVGAIYIPGVSVDDVLAVLQDYDRQSVYYAPDVERSKLESRDGQHFRVFLRFRRHKVITVVLDTEHDIHYFRDAAGMAHSRSSALRIAQMENPGAANEREKNPGDDDGFLWKMETWWRMEARDGGVYVQSEVASLTRNIPTGLGWMVGPFVTSIPKESLTFTLEATRKAVLEKKR